MQPAETTTRLALSLLLLEKKRETKDEGEGHGKRMMGTAGGEKAGEMKAGGEKMKMAIIGHLMMVAGRSVAKSANEATMKKMLCTAERTKRRKESQKRCFWKRSRTLRLVTIGPAISRLLLLLFLTVAS